MHPDPAIKKAIDLVPDNLKDLSHAQVLEVARKIGDIIGRSNQHKRRDSDWRRRMRRHRQALLALDKMFDRMADSGQLPLWMMKGEAGIRENQPVIVKEPPPRVPSLGPSGRALNLGPQRDFNLLTKEQTLPYDPARHTQLVATVRKHIRRLRSFLERLGRRSVEEYASRRGRRLDLTQARKVPYIRTPNLLVFSRDEVLPDAYLGILIDRSGSMKGEKLDRAKAFGALVAESARGLRGIDGHINAFDDETFYFLGNLQRNTVASLTSGGGNNDAGALAWAAKLALQSQKRNRLIIMVSDGSPTECSVEALKSLVARLTRVHGIVCAQAAVDVMEEVAFPNYVDLSRYSIDESIARFGNLLMRLTATWS